MSALEMWVGEFGKEYTERNVVDPESRTAIFRTILAGLDPKRILEVGCNRGHNLTAIKSIFPSAFVVGSEPNPVAREIAKKAGFPILPSALPNLPFVNDHYDLVMSIGVLTHIPPNELSLAISELLRVSSKYVLVMEYPGEEEEVEYRGTKLWKRNLGWHFSSLPVTLMSSGPLRPEDGFNNAHWWLFRK